jgi:thiol:disulfide interchange protein
MKTIKTLITTAFALFLFSGSVMAGGDWMTDVDAALAKAKTDKKPVLVEFTGSDWCPPCMMMHEKVFSKKSFLEKASAKFILVKIDIPRGNKELYEKNQKVLKKYKVKGVPTVILFSKSGKEFDRFTASQYASVSKFLAHLNESLEKKDMD